MVQVDHHRTAEDREGTVDVKQVAGAFGCHIMTNYSRVEEGKIPLIRIGTQLD